MNSNKFEYSYSAPNETERREIEDIKSQFVPSERKEDKLTKLRRLNRKVNNPPKIFAYCFGFASLLIFGVGMTMVLQWSLYLWGSLVTAVGVALMCVTHLIFKAFLKRRKKLYGQDIIDISNELLNENNE